MSKIKLTFYGLRSLNRKPDELDFHIVPDCCNILLTVTHSGFAPHFKQ